MTILQVIEIDTFYIQLQFLYLLQSLQEKIVNTLII